MAQVLMDINELKSVIADTVNLTLEKYKEKEPRNLEFLSRVEAAQLMNICLSTLDKWSKQGKLEKHFLGKVVRYKKSDVLEALETVSKYSRG